MAIYAFKGPRGPTQSAPRFSGIYAIRCLKNDKVYVGSAVNIARRWYEHRTDLNRGIHHSARLQASWTRYGSESFSFEILESCQKDEVVTREQWWIDKLGAALRNSGLNIAPIAGTTAGLSHNKTMRAFFSNINTGRIVSVVTRARLSDAMTGKRASPEVRARMSASRKGKPIAPEVIEQRRIRMTGRTIPDEVRAKISASLKGRAPPEKALLRAAEVNTGRPRSEETRKRISAAHTTDEALARRRTMRTGQKHSPETIEKIRLAKIGQLLSEETKAKISAGRKATHARRKRLALQDQLCLPVPHAGMQVEISAQPLPFGGLLPAEDEMPDRYHPVLPLDSWPIP